MVSCYSWHSSMTITVNMNLLYITLHPSIVCSAICESSCLDGHFQENCHLQFIVLMVFLWQIESCFGNAFEMSERKMWMLKYYIWIMIGWPPFMTHKMCSQIPDAPLDTPHQHSTKRNDQKSIRNQYVIFKSPPRQVFHFSSAEIILKILHMEKWLSQWKKEKKMQLYFFPSLLSFHTLKLWLWSFGKD